MENISKNPAFCTPCFVYNEWPTGFLHFCWQRSSWQLWNWTLGLVTSQKKVVAKKRCFPKFETETPSFFTSNPGIQNTSHLRIRQPCLWNLQNSLSYRETIWLVGFLVDFFETTAFTLRKNPWRMDVYEWNKAFVWMDGSSWNKAFLFKDVILESFLKCNNFFYSSSLPNLIQLCPNKTQGLHGRKTTVARVGMKFRFRLTNHL